MDRVIDVQLPCKSVEVARCLFSYGPVKSCSPVGSNPDRLLERRSGITVEGVSGIGRLLQHPGFRDGRM